MSTQAMPLATLRPKGQLTIPVQILQQWNIQPYDQVEINFQNGVVMMVPVKRKATAKIKSLSAFAGIGRGLWGETSAEVQASIHNLRDSWTR